MTRIGVLTTSYPAGPRDPAGGFVAEHAAWLAGTGFDVEVVAAGRAPGGLGAPPGQVRSGRPDAPRSAAGFSAGRLAVRRVPAAEALFHAGGAPEALAGGGRSWLAAARFSAAFTRAATAAAPAWDAIVAHWLVPSGVVAAAIARGRPVVAIAHSGDVHLLCRLRLVTPVAAALVASGARICFVSEDLRARFVARVAPPLRARVAACARVCPMGIDVARFRAAAAKAARRDRPTVLFLGRLVPVKGAEVAVVASQKWRSNARLVVAGAGPERDRLAALAGRGARARARARAEFVGPVGGEERDRLLASADVVVLPSVAVEGGRSEGFPVTALEAMAAGAAVVASRSGGLAELPPETATLVAPGRPAELAAAVDRLLEDGALRARQTAAAAAYVRRFDWSRVAPALTGPEIAAGVRRPPQPAHRTGRPADLRRVGI